MKTASICKAVLLFFILATLSSCGSVIGFFEEGMGYGTLTFIAVIAIIMILVAPLRKKRFSKRKFGRSKK